MTDEVIHVFSERHFFDKVNSAKYISIIRHFLSRTNNYLSTNLRNDFAAYYEAYKTYQARIQDGYERFYRFDTTIAVHIQAIRQGGLTERFNISFPGDIYTHDKWVSLLKRDNNYECIDEDNFVFVSKMDTKFNVNIHLDDKFEPQYSGPEKVNRLIYPTHVNMFSNTRYKELGIGQMKIAIQKPSNGTMSIGITISNVFHPLVRARDKIRDDIKQMYANSNVPIICDHYEDSLTIRFNDAGLMSSSSKYHQILNNKWELFGNRPKWNVTYTYQEFLIAKEWKSQMRAQLLSNWKTMDKQFIMNCIDCGIKYIRHYIDNALICDIKLI
jgi:hypothetical protein